MRIEVDKLEAASNRFQHVYEPDEIILDEEHVRLTRQPEIRGSASRKGSEVRLRGTVTASAEVDCDRCLSKVNIPVEADFDVTYVPLENDRASGAAELQEEDLSFAVYEGEAIDVDELVREQLLLALPSRALCREECKGLCPICGADRNTDSSCACEQKEIDPRWAGLKAVISDE
jgi:uncharacterized protein